ncbi:MAG: hypothetical protein SNJ84_01565 [Verrucomicrobiia bacterium]
MINHAALSEIYFRHPELQAAYLRRWFIIHVAMPQMETGWQHSRTIASSLKTAFNATSPDLPLHNAVADAMEHLEKLGTWVGEAEKAIAVWPHLTVHGLDADKFIPDPVCQRDALWVLRRLVLNWLHLGGRRATRSTLRWIAQEIVPNAVHPRLEDFEQTYQQLVVMVGQHEALKASDFPPLVQAVVDGTPRAVLSIRLWQESGGVAECAAQMIYQKLPAYAAEAGTIKGAFGENSLELCTRDQSLILRRIALSLDPDIEDPVEFVQLWWNNLVNAYIRTRTPNLFAVQLQCLKEAAEQKLGPAAGVLVSDILAPILPGGEEVDRPKRPQRLQWRRLSSDGPLRHHLPKELSVSLKAFFEEEESQWNSWLQAHRPSALDQAQGLPLNGNQHQAPPHLLNHCEKTLAEQWPWFLLHGGLDDTACSKAAQRLEGKPETAATWEAFIRSLANVAASELGRSDLARTLYLEHWQEWLLQYRAGIFLARESTRLAEAMASHLHQVIPEMLSTAGHSVDANKCTRDFTHVLQTLATLLQHQTAASTRLHLHRFIVQMVAPYTQYSHDVWAMVWRSAEFKRPREEDPAVDTLLTAWFIELENCGRNLTTLRPIAERFNASDEPVFSSEPVEEAAWRDSVNLLLSLAAITSLEDQRKGLDLLAEEAVGSLPIDLEVFASRVDAVMTAVKDWFLDLDLKCLRLAFSHLKEAIQRQSSFRAGLAHLPNLSTKLGQFLKLPQAHAGALLAGALREVFAFPPNSRPMGLSSVHSWTSWVQGQLPGSSESDWQRLQTALSNLFADVPGVDQVADSQLEQLNRAQNEVSIIQNLWKAAASFSSSGTGANDGFGQPLSLARRLAVEAGLSHTDPSPVLEWFTQQCLRANRPVEIGPALDLATQLREHFQSLLDQSPALQTLLEEFLKQLPSSIVAVKLIRHSQQLAQDVVDRSGVTQGEQTIDPVKCRRDVSLLLNSAGWQLLHGQGSPSRWFSTAIAPHLQEPAKQMSSRVYRTLIDLTRQSWHPLEHEVVASSFHDLANA